MTLSEEIECLVRIVKENSVKHCYVIARHYKNDLKLSFEEAKDLYTKMMVENSDVTNLKKQINNVIDDCVKQYKMERWWAEAYVGLDIDKLLQEGFVKAWHEVESAD